MSTCIVENVDKSKAAHPPATKLLLVVHRDSPECDGALSQIKGSVADNVVFYSGESVWVARPCTVFSQKDGVTTSWRIAFTAAIDIMIQ
jgi:hypothetical protein